MHPFVRLGTWLNARHGQQGIWSSENFAPAITWQNGFVGQLGPVICEHMSACMMREQDLCSGRMQFVRAHIPPDTAYSETCMHNVRVGECIGPNLSKLRFSLGQQHPNYLGRWMAELFGLLDGFDSMVLGLVYLFDYLAEQPDLMKVVF